MARIMKPRASPIHTPIASDTKLPKTIPARKTSEIHISGGCVASRSRRDEGGFAACIDVFYHSMELKGWDTILSMPSPKLILVTGATGYVGGRLVPRLLEAGCPRRAR